ncbi:hypothetical protein OUZ56_004299 [Daphnia magna]|uniref:Uncharacterized protein n=1 Tax=Daphnia magna TaxID=35525 RepID=A0ABQ9YPC2_9CRUS|nr:hypothetical protein OUZ56_004299 [Daphnia magna]
MKEDEASRMPCSNRLYSNEGDSNNKREIREGVVTRSVRLADNSETMIRKESHAGGTKDPSHYRWQKKKRNDRRCVQYRPFENGVATIPGESCPQGLDVEGVGENGRGAR